MRNRLLGLTFAVVAALASPPATLSQTAKTGVTKVLAPAPPADLSGVWRRSRRAPDKTRKYTIYELAFSITSEKPPMTPWAEEKFKANKPNIGPNAVSLAKSNDPVISCFPPGVPRIYLQPFPVQIVQTPAELIILYEYDHIVRHVFTDGRKHPEDLSPTYMGHSVGRWDGDTFVVDTVGFNDKSWLDRIGHPHSEDLHVIERFHRTDRDNLELDIAMEDPKILAKPWNAHLGFALHSDWSLMEQVCTDNDAFLNFEK